MPALPEAFLWLPALFVCQRQVRHISEPVYCRELFEQPNHRSSWCTTIPGSLVHWLLEICRRTVPQRSTVVNCLVIIFYDPPCLLSLLKPSSRHHPNCLGSPLKATPFLQFSHGVFWEWLWWSHIFILPRHLCQLLSSVYAIQASLPPHAFLFTIKTNQNISLFLFLYLL